MQEKRLIRPRSGRVLAGVCQGLAQYFGIDVVWVRVAFLLTLTPGGVPGLLLYFIFWMVMPSEA
jgi:phage shock protein C